jgi:hypothetical protein
MLFPYSSLSEAVAQNVGKFRDVMNRQELNIDRIEAMWSELRVEADKTINELYDGLVNEIPENEEGSTWRENKPGIVFNSNDVRKRKGKTERDKATRDITRKE